ncbi:MAG: response regulator, partial [Magnetococcales bacterium]|nr:response regulator [Magnetococcales bacterium]
MAPNLKLLASALMPDYAVIIATHGAKALQLAEAEAPDLILLDVMMPEMNGYEVCRRLKANLHTKEIPVIFITAMEDETSEGLGLQLGAVDYVIKPFNVNIIRLRIKNQLELCQHRRHLEQMVAQRTQELETARAAAESGNRAKQEFLMVVSHELRTPLNQIIGFSDLLEPLLADAEAKYFLDIVSKAGASLLTLIDDIIAFISMEHTPTPSDKTSFSLHPLLQELQTLQQQAATAKGITLTVSVAENLPDLLLGDRQRLKQALRQLISNAVKFTQAGSVVVEVSRFQMQETPDAILFKVSDTGTSIPVEAQESIFDCFTQVEAAQRRSHGGMGLGLAIFKRCVELMDGRYWYEAPPTQG